MPSLQIILSNHNELNVVPLLIIPDPVTVLTRLVELTPSKEHGASERKVTNLSRIYIHSDVQIHSRRFNWLLGSKAVPNRRYTHFLG